LGTTEGNDCGDDDSESIGAVCSHSCASESLLRGCAGD